jgi:hypothetical protein
MKKKLLTILIVGVFLMSLGFVSAICPQNQTDIGGTVYIAGSNTTVSGASVEVLCVTGSGNISKSDTTGGSGAYDVFFSDTETPFCNTGDTVIVTATSGSLSGTTVGVIGTNPGIPYDIENGCKIHVNVEVVDVPLIPEYGLVAGLATVMGAVGIFFYVRRR